MEVTRSEDIHEDPWAFLEKELETFQQVLRELESGRGIFFIKLKCHKLGMSVSNQFPEYIFREIINFDWITYLLSSGSVI